MHKDIFIVIKISLCNEDSKLNIKIVAVEGDKSRNLSGQKCLPFPVLAILREEHYFAKRKILLFFFRKLSLRTDSSENGR